MVPVSILTVIQIRTKLEFFFSSNMDPLPRYEYKSFYIKEKIKSKVEPLLMNVFVIKA